MKQGMFTILRNEPLTAAVWRMKLAGDTGAITAPGQFVNLKLGGFFLRRPISVCDWDEHTLTIVYKVVGQGTAAMDMCIRDRHMARRITSSSCTPLPSSEKAQTCSASSSSAASRSPARPTVMAP